MILCSHIFSLPGPYFRPNRMKIYGIISSVKDGEMLRFFSWKIVGLVSSYTDIGLFSWKKLLLPILKYLIYDDPILIFFQSYSITVIKGRKECVLQSNYESNTLSHKRMFETRKIPLLFSVVSCYKEIQFISLRWLSELSLILETALNWMWYNFFAVLSYSMKFATWCVLVPSDGLKFYKEVK